MHTIVRHITSRWSGYAGLAGAVIATALFLLAFTLATPAAAREEIRSFDSKVTLATNGTVDVVETITVNAEGDQIRHGIFRDIPTQLINDDKSRLRSDLRVLDVQRDGHTEPYTLDSIGTGFQRIRIGDGDVWLDNGPHTYVIHYTMSRMGRFFTDHDELFWNATGNYWDFPIMAATATVTLPQGGEITKIIGNTGRPGSQEQAVTSQHTADTATFAATRELAPGEGLTVGVGFKKGLLVPATGLTAAGYWLSDHRDLVFPTIAVLIVLLYNFFAWAQVGRDPARGTIIPLFHPPEGMSPALMHYINRMGFKQSGWTAFTASIFDLGVKGLVTIDKAGGKTNINATDAASPATLPTGEANIYSYIKSKGQVTIDKTDGPSLNTKRGQLVTEIQSESGQSYFKNNVSYTLIGVAVSAVMLGAMVWLDVLNPAMLIVAAIVAVVVGVIVGIFAGSGAGGIVGKLFGGIWVLIIGFNLFGSGLSFASGLKLDTGFVAAASIIVIEIVFAFLMRAPTVAGRKLMDQIDGFKMYLETAEKNRLNYEDKGEPAMTIKRFEGILPFAIALGVERLWSQRFEADLARNAVADAVGTSYSPLWYSGSDWSNSSSGFSNTVSSMASSMSAAMVAAQPSSSSGSGFSSGGGGGGSGGGGGGGGGGGW